MLTRNTFALISQRGLFYQIKCNTLYNITKRNYSKHDSLDSEEPQNSNTTKPPYQPRNDQQKYRPRDYNNQNQQRPPYQPREGNEQRPPYQKREFNERPSFQKREGEGQQYQNQQKPPYQPREGNEQRPYQPRGDQKPPYQPREGNDQRPPYQPREGNEQRPPYQKREFNERPSFQKREGEGQQYQNQQKPPYQPREGNEQRPYQPRGDQRPPYQPKEGNDQRPSYQQREGNEQRPPYQPRGDQRPPYQPREGNEQRPPYQKREFNERPSFQKREGEGQQYQNQQRPPYQQRFDNNKHQGNQALTDNMNEQINRLRETEKDNVQKKKNISEIEKDPKDDLPSQFGTYKKPHKFEEYLKKETLNDDDFEDFEEDDFDRPPEERDDVDYDREYRKELKKDRMEEKMRQEEEGEEEEFGFSIRGLDRDKHRERLIRNSTKRRGEKETAYSVLMKEKLEKEEGEGEVKRKVTSTKDLKDLKEQFVGKVNEGVQKTNYLNKTWGYFFRVLQVQDQPIYSGYKATDENPPIPLRVYELDSNKNTQTFYNEDVLEFDNIQIINEEGKLIGSYSGRDAIDLAKSKKMDIVVRLVRDDGKSIARLLKMDDYCSEIESKIKKSEDEDLDKLKNVSFLKEKTITVSQAATESHIQDKVNQSEKLLTRGHIVKVVVSFKSNSSDVAKEGDVILKSIVEKLKPIAKSSGKEVRPRLISLIFTPKQANEELVEKQRKKNKKIIDSISNIKSAKTFAEILKEKLGKDIEVKKSQSSKKGVAKFNPYPNEIIDIDKEFKPEPEEEDLEAFEEYDEFDDEDDFDFDDDEDDFMDDDMREQLAAINSQKKPFSTK